MAPMEGPHWPNRARAQCDGGNIPVLLKGARYWLHFAGKGIEVWDAKQMLAALDWAAVKGAELSDGGVVAGAAVTRLSIELNGDVHAVFLVHDLSAHALRSLVSDGLGRGQRPDLGPNVPSYATSVQPVEAPMTRPPDGLVVKYLGGIAEKPPQSVTFVKHRLEISERGVTFHYQFPEEERGTTWKVLRTEPWTRIRSVTLASTQTSRAHIPALLVFGFFGLAARRAPGTFVAVSFSDADVLFSSTQPLLQLRDQFARVAEGNPDAHGKLVFEGTAPPATQPLAPETSISAQLRELSDLRAAGALTEAEFTVAKQRILQG